MPTIQFYLNQKQQRDLHNSSINGKNYKLYKTDSIPIFLSEEQLIKLENSGNVTLTSTQTKEGGFLPALIPLLAAAIPALAAAGSTIAKTVYDVKAQKIKTDDDIRHNKMLEEIARLASTKGAGYTVIKKRYGKGYKFAPNIPNTPKSITKEDIRKLLLEIDHLTEGSGFYLKKYGMGFFLNKPFLG